MSRLSRTWRIQKRALINFLKLPPNDPGGADIPLVRSWLNRLTGLPLPPTALPAPPYPPLAGSPEGDLHSALETLAGQYQQLSTFENGAGTVVKDRRRSDKLVRLVQGAVGSRPGGPGFYADIAVVAQITQADSLDDYKEAVRDASQAAAAFIRVARNKDTIEGTAGIVQALRRLITNNPGVDPDILREVTKLRDAIRESLPREGGGGEGSAFWPSVWVSSSSSSGG
jgi:hypothetical protein